MGHEIAGAHDGAGHELGEEADVEGKIGEPSDGLKVAAVHVNGVAKALKGVKRNPDRQENHVFYKVGAQASIAPARPKGRWIPG